MEPATKEDLKELKNDLIQLVDARFEIVATKEEVAEIAKDVAVIKSIMETEKSNRRWLIGTSISWANPMAIILGAFIKFVP